MSKKSIFINFKSEKAFTLIELLVVIAIIGILSAVVVVSINSARDKSKAAFIKSSLKSLYSQAEIFYTQNGTYAGLYDTTTSDCVNVLSDIAKSMTDQGITVKCFSNNHPFFSDIYVRFGASAIIYDTNTFKAWSVDQNGVATWDQQGVNSSGDYVTPDTSSGITFAIANSACAVKGGRIPSFEQFVTLFRAYGAASLAQSGTTNYVPTSPGFLSIDYWTSTLAPANYGVYASGPSFYSLNTYYKSSHLPVRCVK